MSMKKEDFKHVVVVILIILIMSTLQGGLMASSEGEIPLTEMAKELLALRGINVDTASSESLRFTEARIVETADRLERYLGEKYPGVVFHPDNVILRNYDQAYDLFQLHVEANDQQIQAEARETNDGIAFVDNYYGFLKNDAYESWLGQVFDDLAPGMKIYSTIYCMLDERYDLEMPVEEAANDTVFFAYTWFLLPPSGAAFDELADAFHSRIDSMGLSGEFTVYSMINPLSEDMTKEDAFALIPGHSTSNPVYSNRARFIRRGVEQGDER